MPELNAIDTDRKFFQLLLAANIRAVGDLLTDDFVLIAVMDGNEIFKADLLAVLESGQLRFTSIKSSGVRVRTYGSAAVVTGTTEMRVSFGPQESVVHSRYTHVYIHQDGRWRMASAQGTCIPDVQV